MFGELFLSGLVAQVPYIAVAVVFSILGWRRLRVHHRKAAAWLIAGMAAYTARSIIGASVFAYGAELRIQNQVDGRAVMESLSRFGLLNIGTGVLLLLSLICLGMAAISSRRDPLAG